MTSKLYSRLLRKTQSLPDPTDKTLAHLRYAIMIFRRREQGESRTALACELKLSQGQVLILERVGWKYLKAPRCLQRLKEARPTAAGRIGNALHHHSPRVIETWKDLEPAGLVRQVKSSVITWARARGKGAGLDDETLYRSSRWDWHKPICNFGVFAVMSFFEWVDECETGMRPPMALDGFPPGSVIAKPRSFVWRT